MKYKNEILYDSLDIANNFNDYFINSINELALNLTPTQQNKGPQIEDMKLDLKATNELEIKKILTGLSNSKSKDIHGLDCVMIKKLQDNFLKPLTKLTNSSIQQNNKITFQMN